MYITSAAYEVVIRTKIRFYLNGFTNFVSALNRKVIYHFTNSSSKVRQERTTHPEGWTTGWIIKELKVGENFMKDVPS